MFKSVLLAAAALTLSAGAASAQAPPMDMSWGINSQIHNQMVGDMAARNAAMAYYNYMRSIRAQGYRGPSLPTGVTNESLRASINGANEASQRYIRGAQVNSARTSNAVGDWDMRAVRNCFWARSPYGDYGYVCR